MCLFKKKKIESRSIDYPVLEHHNTLGEMQFSLEEIFMGILQANVLNAHYNQIL